MLTAAWRGKRDYRKGINDQVNEGSSLRSGATTRLTPQQIDLAVAVRSQGKHALYRKR